MPLAQDRFAAVTRAFYKNAIGAVVVCDVTRQSTLEAVAQWKAEIDSKVSSQRRAGVVSFAHRASYAGGFQRRFAGTSCFVGQQGRSVVRR